MAEKKRVPVNNAREKTRRQQQQPGIIDPRTGGLVDPKTGQLITKDPRKQWAGH